MTSESALREAKRPRNPVAGPYGHPFHPILVTLPIGAWVASLVFDIAGAATGEREVFGPGAALLIAIGIVAAVLAAVPGLLDFTGIAAGTRAKQLALTHMAINLTVVAVFAISWILRVTSEDATNVAGVVLSVLGLLGLGVSGFLGGELAYRHGVRVADEDTQREGHAP